jgi:SAM-dependent methyltransferase
MASSENNYVFDPDSSEELARLTHQDRLLTKAMGGVFQGVSASEIATFRNVLDLGCGPGGWVLDVAFEYPNIEAAGIDIGRPMVDYANARARSQQLTNASFGVMDFNQPFEFSDGAFDLVNGRLLIGSLLREIWPRFIAECTRILRPGGRLQITEPIDLGVTSSPALDRMAQMMFEGSLRVGLGFPVGNRTANTTHMLPRLFRQAGYQDIKLIGHAIEFSAETEAWTDLYRNFEVAYHMARPLFIQTGLITDEEFEKLYQEMLIEMHASDFAGVWNMLTVTGTRPEAK